MLLARFEKNSAERCFRSMREVINSHEKKGTDVWHVNCASKPSKTTFLKRVRLFKTNFLSGICEVHRFPLLQVLERIPRDTRQFLRNPINSGGLRRPVHTLLGAGALGSWTVQSRGFFRKKTRSFEPSTQFFLLRRTFEPSFRLFLAKS